MKKIKLRPVILHYTLPKFDKNRKAYFNTLLSKFFVVAFKTNVARGLYLTKITPLMNFSDRLGGFRGRKKTGKMLSVLKVLL